MRSYAFGRLAAVIALGAVSASCLFAQATFVTNPSSLTFDISSGTPSAQNVDVSVSTGQAAVVFSYSSTPGVNVQVVNSPELLPNTLRVTINPAALPPGSLANITLSGTGLQSKTIPINVVNGSAPVTFGVNPASGIAFVQNGTATPGAASVSVVSSNGVIPSYTTAISYVNGTNWMNVDPYPGILSTSPAVTITPVTGHLPAGVYNGSVTLTASGFNPVVIPVSLSINQTTGTPLTVSPGSLSFFGNQNTTQGLLVSSGVTTTYTVTLSSNLSGYVQVTGTGSTNSTLQVTVPNPLLVPAGTTGTLTITPAAGSGYSSAVIPISINPSGLSTLVVNPTSLAFTGVIGSIDIPRQLLSVTSGDFSQRQFQVTASSTSNFLTVDNTFQITPANVAVGVNMAAITQPGTYFGTLSITPLTGGGNTTFVQVTLNAIQGITVTPDQTSVALTARAGSNFVQRDVLLNSSISNVPFTATATTTSGGIGWLTVGASSGNLPSTISIFANPAGLATGTYTGSVVVTAQGVTVATIPVTFTVTPAATLQLSPTSLVFNYESTSSTVPTTQTVQITGNGANVSWNAAVVSSGNWLQVTPTTGTTPGSLSVSVSPAGLSAGTYTGSISVSSSGASNSPQTISVTLNVTTPAVPLVTSFQNAGSFEQSLAVPGSIITIRGTDLGPATGVSGQINSQGFLATTLSDVEVLFDGIPAPIIYASATQINTVVPYEVYGRTTTRLQIRYRTQRSRDLELRVQDVGPGLFTSNSSGTGQAAALNQNGSINSASNPEQRGNVIVLYATGQGQTSPGGTTGRIMTGTDLRRPLANVTVRIGGQNAEVPYAGSAPGLIAGAVQINARIPANSILGQNVPVQVQVGNSISQSNVTIAVQ